MTSLLSNLKTVNNEAGYYINVGDLRSKIYARTEPTGNTGTLGGGFSAAIWATSTLANGQSWVSTALATSGGAILRDMGRSIVSSTRTFRKVQLVVPANRAPSTFGVGGGTIAGENYFTGYIELGFGPEGGSGGPGDAGGPAPVAHYGR